MAQNLSIEEKQGIQQLLLDYANGYASQAKAANSLQGVLSPGTFNSIVNGKFEKISDDMFLRVRAAVTGGHTDKDMDIFLSDAQQFHNVSWVVAPAGIGKTTAAAQYAKSHRNVFVLLCSSDMHKADFVEELAK